MGAVSLKMFLIYSGKASAQLATRVAASLQRKLGSDFCVRESTWNSELLQSPKLRALAATEAMDSDLVLIATAEGNPLDEELNKWFELWQDRPRETPSALVALLQRETADAPHPVEKSLRQFAASAHMDFFCHSQLEWQIERPRPAAEDWTVSLAS